MAGRIDPTLKARTGLEQKIIDRARTMGFSLRRLRPGSNAVVLVGPGVHITAPDLEDLKKSDFGLKQSRRCTIPARQSSIALWPPAYVPHGGWCHPRNIGRPQIREGNTFVANNSDPAPLAMPDTRVTGLALAAWHQHRVQAASTCPSRASPGRRWAAEVLPWNRVAALAAERATMNEPGLFDMWILRREDLAPEITVRVRAEWVAFLDGVAEVAALV